MFNRSTPQLMHGVDGSASWYTPQVIIDLVHRCFPGGFLDPCSSPTAQERVRALHYLTDGLNTDWKSFRLPVFINPPGGRARLTQKFWDKFMAEQIPGIWLHFSLDSLQTLQRPSGNVLDHDTFIFDKRLPYYSPSLCKEVPGLRPSALTFVRYSPYRETVDLKGTWIR